MTPAATRPYLRYAETEALRRTWTRGSLLQRPLAYRERQQRRRTSKKSAVIGRTEIPEKPSSRLRPSFGETDGRAARWPIRYKLWSDDGVHQVALAADLRLACLASSPAVRQQAGRWSSIRASTRSRSPAARRPDVGSDTAAPTLKHVSLELSGKAAAIVLEDALLDRLVPTVTQAFMFNNGQMCIRPSRLLVPKHRKNEIVDAFAKSSSAS